MSSYSRKSVASVRYEKASLANGAISNRHALDELRGRRRSSGGDAGHKRLFFGRILKEVQVMWIKTLESLVFSSVRSNYGGLEEKSEKIERNRGRKEWEEGLKKVNAKKKMH